MRKVFIALNQQHRYVLGLTGEFARKFGGHLADCLSGSVKPTAVSP
jgi:hypothetical protein